MEASRTKELYEAVLTEDWETMKRKLSEVTDVTSLLHSISIHRDNVIHLAVHSGAEEPLKQILKLVKPEMMVSFTSSVNVHGNTVLHEAAISGNLAAVKLLVNKNEELLEMKNDSGETPLFRAAAFGQTEIIKFLASPKGQRVISFNRDMQLKDIHRGNNDGASILRAAIQGKQFGTALELLKQDPKLLELEEEKGTSLYMLAKIPSVFSSKYQMGFWEKLLYSCIPIGLGNYDNTITIKETENEDIERGLREGLPPGCNHEVQIEYGDMGLYNTVIYKVYASIWSVLIDAISPVKKLWQKKKERALAFKLAPKLIENDRYMRLLNKDGLSEEVKEVVKEEDEEEEGNPLFTSIKTGNVGLVNEILKEYPQALEQVNNKKQNMLHLAAMYRQKEIFDLVKENDIPMIRLARQIDVNGYTVLHSVANTQHSKGTTGSGPAYQLMDELKWFYRVEEIMPSYYTMLPANNKQTAWELFEAKHKDLLKESQEWIKGTSLSCSAVAVLVATVVFAAAFTVPGGNKNGKPILVDSPFFMFFTVTDIISLSCSLTAVVMFLSILTSPFELENFLDTLPSRLKIGFGLLFISVATTMLTFVSTIILLFQLDKRLHWTSTLICFAAFFPVSVLALTHFAFLKSFITGSKEFFDIFLAWIKLPFKFILSFLKFLGKSVRQLPKSQAKLKI